MNTATDTTIIPSHVAPKFVYDFDFHLKNVDADRLHDSLQFLHSEAPDVFWTPRNGGHWAVTRYDPIVQIVQDPEHFSVREMIIPRIENPPVFIPLSLDPPDNIPYRQALMPVFSPKSVKEMEQAIRQWATKIVSSVASQGHCEFITDIATLLPISIFMELMGMDLGRLREFRAVAEQFFLVQNDAEAFAKVSAKIIGIMSVYIKEKEENPDDSLISKLLQAPINGRPIRFDEMQSICFLLFAGGMHTVTNVLGFTFQQLASDSDMQAKLVADSERINDFIDESLRMFGIINTSRIVAKDISAFNVNFKKNDMVLCMLPLAGRDDRIADNPTKFDIDRNKKEHVMFSRGPHLCVGHFLARAEMRILIEEWLKSIPQFSIDKHSPPHYSRNTSNGIENLNLIWQA